MKDGYRFVDCDMHIMEPMDLFDKYLDPEFKPRVTSSVRRQDGGWAVTLEVVEVRRIPDSTDVLSSYELVLDDDGGIVELNRKRRYRRSQVEES